jgi:two-component system, NarL family, response regulator LiaR
VRRRVRVALANDYEIVVAGLSALLAPFAPRVEIVDFVLLSRGGARRRIKPVDVVLFDTFGRPGLGLADVKRLHDNPGVARVAVFTWQHSPRLVGEALRVGAAAYLSKATTAEELVEQLERIARGETIVSTHFGGRVGEGSLQWPGRARGLTARESEVLALLAAGHRNADIAAALYVSVDTVKTHLRSIFRKLGVTNRAQAVASALTEPSFAVFHGPAHG